MPSSHGASQSSSGVEQRRVGHVGPFAACAAWSWARANSHARPPLLEVARPRQAAEAERADAVEHRRAWPAAPGIAQRLVLEHQRAEAAHATRDDGLAARVPGDARRRRSTSVREVLARSSARSQRRREVDACLALAGVELRDDDELAARERGRARQRRAATVAQQVAAAARRPRATDAVRVGEREQQSDRVGAASAGRPGCGVAQPGRAAARAAARRARMRRSRAAVDRDSRAAAARRCSDVDAMAQVGIARPALRRATDRAPTSSAAISHARSREPERRARSIMCASRGCDAECRHVAPERRHAAARVERLEPLAAGRAPARACAAGGGSSQASVAASVAPQQASSSASGARSASRISAGACGGSAACCRLGPQSVAHAGRRAAGAAAALVGRRARDAHGLEPAHAARGIEALATLEPRVDDDAHAVDGEAGLGDVGRDDDLAASPRRRPQRRVLRRGVEIAVQRQHRAAIVRRRCRRARRRRGGSPPRPAGTTSTSPGCASSARSTMRRRAARSARASDGAGARARRVVRSDVEHAARRTHDRARRRARAPAHRRRASPTSPAAAGRRAGGAGIERQREAEVGLQVALVELVEDHAGRRPRAPGRAAASA